MRIAGHGANRAAIVRDGGAIDVRIILDSASVEVLCGAVAISALLDGHDMPWTVRLAADPVAVTIGHLGVHPLTRSSRSDEREPGDAERANVENSRDR